MQEFPKGFLDEYFRLETPVRQEIKTFQPPPSEQQPNFNADKSTLTPLSALCFSFFSLLVVYLLLKLIKKKMVDFAIDSPRKYSIIASGGEDERAVSFINQSRRTNYNYHANNTQSPPNIYNDNSVYTIVSPSSSSDDCRNYRNSADMFRNQLPKSNRQTFRSFGGKLSHAFKNLVGKKAGRNFNVEEGINVSASCSSDLFNDDNEVCNGEIAISNCVVTSLLKKDNNNIDNKLVKTDTLTHNTNTTACNNNNITKQTPLTSINLLIGENPEIKTIKNNNGEIENSTGYEIQNKGTKQGKNKVCNDSNQESGEDDNACIVSEDSSNVMNSLSTFTQISIDDGFEEKIKNDPKEPNDQIDDEELNRLLDEETACENNNNINNNNEIDTNYNNKYTDSTIILTDTSSDSNTIHNSSNDNENTDINNVNIIDNSDNNDDINSNNNDTRNNNKNYTDESVMNKKSVEDIVCLDVIEEQVRKEDIDVCSGSKIFDENSFPIEESGVLNVQKDVKDETENIIIKI